ncbi:hypothetical protein BU17DRAFT_78785 [Hysterangium stoloniferum]|nr:hypothetical protein BU17DRAFT_78785 [Hysterangium stoloniferum]
MPLFSKLRNRFAKSNPTNADCPNVVRQSGDIYNDPGFGIKELVPGITPCIDIVAIHGFDGHREESWTADNGKLWLRDFLPQTIPTARILSYGYDAYTESSLSEQTLYGHAQDFLARLCMSRKTDDTKERPIIFIAHSLGGIILKSALIQANVAHEGHLLPRKWIHLSTYGIVFFGTPHQGTDIVPKFVSLCSRPNNILLKHLSAHSELLQQQIADFNAITAHFHMTFFYETLPTTLPGHISTIIVPKASAVLPGAVNIEPISMHKDHTGMSKFQSVNDDDYKSVLCTVQDMVKNALANVHGRWIKFHQQNEDDSKGPIYMSKHRSSPRFVGQEKYLTRLGNFFAPENSHPVWNHFLLYGMGGVGKTQICLKFIEELLGNDCYFWRIFWIDGTNTETLTNGFSQIADDPEAQSKGIKKSPDAVLRWLTATQKKCLMIFDNADGMDGVVKDYLQQICQIHVLITSRNPGLARDVTDSLEVLSMESDQALALFQAAAKFDNNSNTVPQELLEKVVAQLGFLPLAIDIAGAAISTGLCEVAEYLMIHEKYHTDIFDADNPSMKGALGYNHTVYSTLRLSYDLIEKQAILLKSAQDALFILKVLGFFHHQNIMESIFKQAAEFPPANTYDGKLQTTSSDLPGQLLRCNSDGEWESLPCRLAMQVLCDYSLLSRDPATQYSYSWTMHPLIHMWIRDQALGEDDTPHYYAARALIVGSINREEMMKDILFRQELLPHVIANQGVPNGRKQGYYDDLCERSARVYSQAGKWSNAKLLEIQVVESREQILGTEHPDTLRARANLAGTYRQLGRWTNAKQLEVLVLEASKRILGTEHPDTLRARANLAVTYHQLGRWTDAEQLEIQVLEAREQILGTEHPDTLRTRANLAGTYRQLGRWTDAEHLEVLVLEATKRILGTEHPDTLRARANLAGTYHQLGRWTAAEQLEVQVLEAREQIFSTEHPDTLTAKANLAATYHQLGRWTDAEQLEALVLESSKRILGTEHPDTLRARANLAAIYYQLGRWTDAEQLELQVLESSKRILGTEHPDTLRARANLAATYHQLGRWTSAEQLEVQVLEAREQIFSTEHPDILTARANLAATYHQLGRWTDAEQLELQVLESSKRILGSEHPDTLRARANLAATYRQLGRWTSAEQLEVLVLEDTKRILGTEHPDTLRARANLAVTYHQLGRSTDAEQLEIQVLKAREQILGTEHPDTLRTRANLAATYRQLGRWTSAEQLEVLVLEDTKRILGTEHPDTLRARANLAATYRQLGRWTDAEQLEVLVLEASKRILGTEHPDTLRARANLAVTYHQLGRWTDAEQLEVQVLESREQILGTEHPDTLRARANLAATYCQLGRRTSAEQLEVQVLEAREQILGTEHPDTLRARANLAATYYQLGRWTDAEQLELQVLESSKRILGTEHPDTLRARANLAATYRQLGRWTNAEQLEVLVLEDTMRVLGTKHPDTLRARANLAVTYHHLSRWTDAEQLEVLVLEAREQILGTEHPDTLRARANLATTYHQLGKWTDAEQLEVQLLESNKRILGTEHPETLRARANLAVTYHHLGRWTDAEQLEVLVLEGREMILCTEHPDTLMARANLAARYHQLCRWTDTCPNLVSTIHPNIHDPEVLTDDFSLEWVILCPQN